MLDTQTKSEVKYYSMAKSLLRFKARELRRSGKSIKNIAIELKVAKTTVSYWVKDIILTENQLFLLKQAELSGK